MIDKDWEYDRSAEVRPHHATEAKARIAESWARCRDFGLQASGTPRELVLSEGRFKSILEQDEHVRRFVLPELELLYNQIAGTNFMVAYANPDGIVLDSIQDQDFKAGDGGKAVIPGSVWLESKRGTNALGLAIHSRQPSIVTGADHFFHRLNDLSCFAVPIFDHADDLLGVIDATSNARSRNEHTLALVKLAARNVENRIFSQQFDRSLILKFHARQEYLPTTSVAMIAIDDYGFIEGANSNAKLVLSGLNLGRRQHFDAIFDTQFFEAMDKLKIHDTIQIRDRLGSVVFMQSTASLKARILSFQGPTVEVKGPSGPGLQPAPSPPPFFRHRAESDPAPALVFEDEALRKNLSAAVNALRLGVPITVLGEDSTGKTELSRELARLAFEHSSVFLVDCSHVSAETFDDQMFGKNGRVGFFDLDQPFAKSGKLFHARGGVVMFKNAHRLEHAAQETLAAALSFEDTHRDNRDHKPILGWIFTGPQDWLQTPDTALAPAFKNAIYGKTLIAPALRQRTDFDKIAEAMLAGFSSQHKLSRPALRKLKSRRWEGNFQQLKKVIRLAVANSTDAIIRDEIERIIENLLPGQEVTPCPRCEGSPVRTETCLMIQRAWSEAGGNVSMVARRLGISRNTVYKHIAAK